MTTTINPEDLSTPEIIANPFHAYKALRDISPVFYPRVPANKTNAQSEPTCAWAVMRHADIMQIVRDPETFSSKTPKAFNATAYFPLIHDDGSRHAQLRRTVNKSLSPAAVAELSGGIGELVDEMLNDIGSGSVEFMHGYAVPLPIRIMARLLGLPESDYNNFRIWSEAYVSYAHMRGDERARKLRDMAEYLTKVIAEREGQPTNDLLSDITKAKVDGQPLSDEHKTRFAQIVIFGASETSTNLIGNLLGLVVDRPELWQRMREDRSLVDQVIEEVLRYEAPLQRKLRVATRDVRIGEAEIKAGDLVDLCYGAAGRDPAVFENPDTFDPERKEKGKHISFGYGIHFCPGAMLSRLETRLTVNAMLDRYASVERGDEPAVRQNAAPLVCGYRSLPLVLR